MKGPERRSGHTNTGRIVDIKPGYELARDHPNPIAIIRARQQVMGDRRIRDIWYPLVEAQEQELKVGQSVVITRRTEKVGKGSLTTSTIRLA